MTFVGVIFLGCMPHDVDKVIFNFGFPMGPFQMGDLAGTCKPSIFITEATYFEIRNGIECYLALN